MTKWKGLLIGLLVVAVLVGGLFALSFGVLRTDSPFSTVSGMIWGVLVDADYVVIRDDPKVIVAAPGVSLDAYMWENGGYLPVPEEQLGAMLVYQNTDGQVRILYSANGYFAKWEWQD